MPEKARSYIAIDLKSFYASVECVQRGYDPLNTNLVVADKSRTEKTICLAVSPSLKSYGIPGRARLFEVLQRVEAVNRERLRNAPGHKFFGSSVFYSDLKTDPSLKLDFVIAPPQMAHYIDISTKVYENYLKYVSADDIHVYSIDEVFIDATDYLKSYGLSARELATKMIHGVLEETGVTATAGIGTNLYLCKIAMDIVAKHCAADSHGVRIAELTELSYRKKLWEHRPLTDFWRLGSGYSKKLEAMGLYTMGDIAEYSLSELGRARLYKLFGVGAELLIDHAWGYEPCTIKAIKDCRVERKSLGSGQVLSSPHSFEAAKLIAHEMADALALDLQSKKLCAEQIVLDIGFDRESLNRPDIASVYSGEVKLDRYGRSVPAHAHGSANLPTACASSELISRAVLELFERIVDPRLLIRKVALTAARLCSEDEVCDCESMQLDLFSDEGELETRKELLRREKRRQEAILKIQGRYGKNSIVKGLNMQEGATMMERNSQIGGHKA